MTYNTSPIKDIKISLTDWQARGLRQTATGYGRKLLTRFMLKLSSSPRWLRIYCICYSNCGTIYIMQKNKPVYFTTEDQIAIDKLVEGLSHD